MPRFRDLKPVLISQVAYRDTFYAKQVDEPKKMSDLFECCHCSRHSNCMTHYDDGKMFHYEIVGNETVYVPKNAPNKRLHGDRTSNLINSVDFSS
jgi:hypothetical protein